MIYVYVCKYLGYVLISLPQFQHAFVSLMYLVFIEGRAGMRIGVYKTYIIMIMIIINGSPSHRDDGSSRMNSLGDRAK